MNYRAVVPDADTCVIRCVPYLCHRRAGIAEGIREVERRLIEAQQHVRAEIEHQLSAYDARCVYVAVANGPLMPCAV